jgi:hypothetical protein
MSGTFYTLRDYELQNSKYEVHQVDPKVSFLSLEGASVPLRLTSSLVRDTQIFSRSNFVFKAKNILKMKISCILPNNEHYLHRYRNSIFDLCVWIVQIGSYSNPKILLFLRKTYPNFFPIYGLSQKKNF